MFGLTKLLFYESQYVYLERMLFGRWGNKKEFDMVTHGKVVNRFNFVVICTFIFLCVSVSSFANQVAAPVKAGEATSIVDETTSNAIVNINTASVEQLSTLPGVGASLAERIVKYRTEVGTFKAPEELVAVKGVGQKKLDKMINMIVVK